MKTGGHRNVTPDDDWLFPESSPPSVPPTARNGGVLRADDPCDRPEFFESLIDALNAGPPRTPEAQIRAKGTVLASCNEEKAEWSVSPAGFARIEAEAHNRPILDEERRREIADEWEHDAWRESMRAEVAEVEE